MSEEEEKKNKGRGEEGEEEVVGKGRAVKGGEQEKKKGGREKGRVKVQNDGRMSAQQEVTVEVLLSAHGPLFILFHFIFIFSS